MISDPISAARALLVQCAQDTFTAAPADVAPPLDARIAGDWELAGHLIANDCVFRKGLSQLGQDVCYGFIARNRADPTQYSAVVRGTGDLWEWVEDAEFLPATHPTAGHVEGGFWGVYRTMRYVAIGAAPIAAPVGIASAVGANRVFVVGHSLGAALASYLTFDLAALVDPMRLEATILASPQPGDLEFAEAFEKRVLRYQVINRVVDAVPHVPFGPDYTHLFRCKWLWPWEEQVRVRTGVFCQHHVSTYAAALHYASLLASKILPIDAENVACIKAVNGSN